MVFVSPLPRTLTFTSLLLPTGSIFLWLHRSRDVGKVFLVDVDFPDEGVSLRNKFRRGGLENGRDFDRHSGMTLHDRFGGFSEDFGGLGSGENVNAIKSPLRCHRQYWPGPHFPSRRKWSEGIVETGEREQDFQRMISIKAP